MNKYVLILVFLAAIQAGTVCAATQYWDTASSPGLQGGNGTWSGVDANWSDDPGGTALSPWITSNNAWLALSSDNASSLITLSNIVKAGILTINGGEYRLAITNGGQLTMATNGGTLTTYIGYGTGASNNAVIVVGGPGVTSCWDLGGQTLYIGYNGNGATTTNNMLVIDGAGVPGSAIVTNLGIPFYNGLAMGHFASANNLLIITNGGALFATNGCYCTPGVSTASNTVIVTGSGSLYAAYGLYITGADGLFCVERGGVVTSQYWWVRSSGDHGNRVIVTNGGRCYGGIDYIGMVGTNEHCNSVQIWGGMGVTSLWDFTRFGVKGPVQINGGTNNFMLIDGAGYDGSAVGTNASYIVVGWSHPIYGTNYGDYLVVTNRGRLHASGALTVGIGGNCNRASAARGGKIYVGGVYVGSGASNEVRVCDPDSLISLGSQPLVIGYNGGLEGRVTIDRGGTLDNAGTVTVYPANYLKLLGGTLGLSDTVYTNGLFVVGDGIQSAALKVLSGGTVMFNDGLLINTNAVLRGQGRVNGGSPGIIIGDGASLSPGVLGATNVTGILTNVGTLAFAPGASAMFEIAGHMAPGNGWGVLMVTNGTVTLNGSLKAKLVSDYTPDFADSFMIMSNVAPFDGTFNNAVNDGRINVYSTNMLRVVGTMRVGISNSCVFYLDSFRPYSTGAIIFAR